MYPFLSDSAATVDIRKITACTLQDCIRKVLFAADSASSKAIALDGCKTKTDAKGYTL